MAGQCHPGFPSEWSGHLDGERHSTYAMPATTVQPWPQWKSEATLGHGTWHPCVASDTRYEQSPPVQRGNDFMSIFWGHRGGGLAAFGTAGVK